MALRVDYEGSNDVGVFCTLTNSYCLVGVGGTQNFYSTLEAELADIIPVVHTDISSTRIVGRLTVGKFSTKSLKFEPEFFQETVTDSLSQMLLLIKSFNISETPCLTRLPFVELTNVCLLLET